MFGTEEAARIIVRELGTITAVTAVVGTRIHYLPVYPGSSEFPGVIITPLASDHHQPVNSDGEVMTEMVQIEVAFTDEGTSANGIRAAANAGMKHLRGLFVTETIDGDQWTVTFNSLGGLPRLAVADETGTYRQLGGVLQVEFHRA